MRELSRAEDASTGLLAMMEPHPDHPVSGEDRYPSPSLVIFVVARFPKLIYVLNLDH